VAWVTRANVDEPHDLAVDEEPNSCATGQLVLPTGKANAVTDDELQLGAHRMISLCLEHGVGGEMVPCVNHRAAGRR
jgi:hypothetical protein